MCQLCKIKMTARHRRTEKHLRASGAALFRMLYQVVVVDGEPRIVGRRY